MRRGTAFALIMGLGSLGGAAVLVSHSDRASARPAAQRSVGLHRIFQTPLEAPFPGMQVAIFGMGCFWGAEKTFWQLPGVVSTAVGYAGGSVPHPTYREVCSGTTGHAEVVRVVFDPTKTTYERLLKAFWEGHDPTQGLRQGADVGSQYRSVILVQNEAQRAAATTSLAEYQPALQKAGFPAITTEIKTAPAFHFAEPYHQQYLDANPGGYCGHGGTGVACPIGLKVNP